MHRSTSLALLLAFGVLLFGVVRAIGQTDAERLERLERAVEALQKRNAELEAEVRALKQKPAAAPKAHQVAAAETPSDAKRVVEKETRKEEKKRVTVTAAASELKLTLGGFIQAQFEAGDVFAFEGRFSDGPREIDDRFRIRRARITLAGEYAEHFDFKAEGEFALTDASGNTRTSFGATDLFLNWRRYPEFNIKAGQYKAPFGLEQITSDTKLFTPERTLVTTALTPERQIGVQLWGRPFANLWPEQKDLLIYYAGVFNGTGRNITVNDNDHFMYVGRVEVQAMKTKLLNDDATLRFGANYLYSGDEAGTTVSSALREGDDGSLGSLSLPSPGTREGWGVDAWLHIGPFDLIAEYISEDFRARGLTPLFATFAPNGYYVQGSYYVLPKKLQLVTKWESFDPDQAVDDEIHSLTAGVNYYLKGDDIKLLAHYIHSWSDFRDTRPGSGSDEFDEVILRLQVMF